MKMVVHRVSKIQSIRFEFLKKNSLIGYLINILIVLLLHIFLVKAVFFIQHMYGTYR